MYTYMPYTAYDLFVIPKTPVYLREKERELSGKIIKCKPPKRTSDIHRNIRPIARWG